jgi:mannose/cellobiose epimerase-like protein (N-acyl-D-glucosamine 2-epimerase family)
LTERDLHRQWLTDQALTLLRFFRPIAAPDGWFADLDDDGNTLTPAAGGSEQELLLTVTRAVHSYAAGELLGVPGCAPVVDAGLEALLGRHRDREFGGYYTAVGRDGRVDPVKAAYGHAHVLLAASTALAAGHGNAQGLFDDVLAVIDAHFWDEQAGAARESFDRDWANPEPYRGQNSNMHLCEALLAAAEVSRREDLAQRAGRIAQKLIDGFARANDWLLPEHYSADWEPELEYNSERLDDPFRPYGATVGHSLEWSRLVLGVAAATNDSDSWYLPAAEALFGRAVRDGWDPDGGFYYTLGWDGRPANPDRYWWPVAEGIGASLYLARLTGKPLYERWYRCLWDYAAHYLIDGRRGGWYAELDPLNHRKVHPWFGKPDIYHSLQATLLPLLPSASSLAGAVHRSLI